MDCRDALYSLLSSDLPSDRLCSVRLPVVCVDERTGELKRYILRFVYELGRHLTCYELTPVYASPVPWGMYDNEFPRYNTPIPLRASALWSLAKRSPQLSRLPACIKNLFPIPDSKHYFLVVDRGDEFYHVVNGNRWRINRYCTLPPEIHSATFPHRYFRLQK